MEYPVLNRWACRSRRHRWPWAMLAITSALLVIAWPQIADGWTWLHHPHGAIAELRMGGIPLPVAFVVVQAIATVLCVPGTVLVMAGGVWFGLAAGTAWSVLGATLGAIAAFGMARSIGHTWVERRWGHHPRWHRWRNPIRRSPFRTILLLRLAPIAPFNVLNFVLGLFPVPWFTYLWATLIGILPGTLAYTWLGTAGHRWLHGDRPWEIFAALALLSILTLLPLRWQNHPWGEPEG